MEKSSSQNTSLLAALWLKDAAREEGRERVLFCKSQRLSEVSSVLQGGNRMVKPVTVHNGDTCIWLLTKSGESLTCSWKHSGNWTTQR